MGTLDERDELMSGSRRRIGADRRRACYNAGIKYETFPRWCADDPDFALPVETAAANAMAVVPEI